jgi:hypothetical protein
MKLGTRATNMLNMNGHGLAKVPLHLDPVQRGYRIEPTEIAHIRELYDTLRDQDRSEILNLGFGVKKALWRAYRNSIMCKTALVADKVAAIWGLGIGLRAGVSPLSDLGVPWLHTSAAIENIPVSFVRVAKAEVAAMRKLRPRLESFVAADYAQAIKFLRLLGFVIDEPEPTGLNGAHYCRFYLTRELWEACRAQTKRRRPGASFAPFIIYTAGRSRTAWLAAFLSYGRSRCHTEVAIKMRNMQDVVSFFATPGTGSTETGAAPGWQLIRHYVPAIKTVVVRRPLDEIVASFARSEVADIAAIDEAKLRRIIAYENRCLDKISLQPGTLTVDFKDLGNEDVCSAIFEHCLPYRFDVQWWRFMKDQNIQSNVRAIFHYYRDNRDEVEEFKRAAKRQMIALARAGEI